MAPPAIYWTGYDATNSLYRAMCLSSARMALFKVHPYFSRNEVGTSAEISKRGLHNPRIAPFKSFVVDILTAEVMIGSLQLQLTCAEVKGDSYTLYIVA